MARPDILDEYSGARATPGVVNREEVLQQIRTAVDGSGARVLYLRGEGGTGKTRILRAVLEYCQEGGKWYQDGLLAVAPDRLVDLYHTRNHSREGLARALRDSLEPPEGAFSGFDGALEKMTQDRYGLAGMHTGLSETEEECWRAFLAGWNDLARERRLVVALDTAERLLYGEHEIQRRLGLEPEPVAALDWLLKMLSRLENTVVLIAGRPRPERLREDLEGALGDRLSVLELGPLDLEDSKRYFDAVAEATDAAGQVKQAERVKGIPAGVREVIWLCAEGRPIMLALMIDYLMVADQLLPRVKEPAQQVRALLEREPKAREEFERELVRFWQETGRECDQAVVALAWARRGMDADLLARVTELRREDGAWDTDRAKGWLDEIRDLSFVKIRPADERVFLHDEMYALLERYVLREVTEPRRGRIYSAILDYYTEKVLAQRGHVDELRTPRREHRPGWDVDVPLGQPRPPDDPRALAEAADRLYNLMAEEVHYRLRRDPVDGFQTYQLYTREAVWANEDSMDHLMHSELLLFLDDHRGEDRFDGLHRAEVELYLFLNRLERYIRASDRRAVELPQRLRRECAELLDQAGPLDRIRLDVLEGEALLYVGRDLLRAEELPEGAVAALEGVPATSAAEAWKRSIRLAEAHNNLGYLYRIRGWFRKAVDAYGRAVEQWCVLEEQEKDESRRRSLRAQHANTLNNLAWPLAELGRFETALHTCQDALEMRERLGPGAPVALSLNTLGLILTRDDKPHRARVHCERALSLFLHLDHERGVGLASIALAESLRRMSAVDGLYAWEEAAALLRRAAKYASEAVGIFERRADPERPRLIEALIERGCVRRQWAWLALQAESVGDLGQEGDPDWLELTARSREDLQRAMELAGQDFPFRYLDACVNLAWLYYYVRENERAEEEARNAIASVDPDYLMGADQGPAARDLSHTFYWLLLGKVHLLLGHLAFRRFEETGDSQGLIKAGESYTLSLAYDGLYAEDFRDVRRAVAVIYKRLRGLNRDELGRLYEGIAHAVQEYGLPEPTRMDAVLRDHQLPPRLAAAGGIG